MTSMLRKIRALTARFDRRAKPLTVDAVFGPNESPVRTKLELTDLRRTDFSGSNLTGSDMTFCDLRGANLTAANLTNAKLYGSRLDRCILDNSNLSGTDLIGNHQPAQGLTQKQLNQADRNSHPPPILSMRDPRKKP